MHAAEPQLETAAAIEAQIAAQVAADLNLALTLTLTLTLTHALTRHCAASGTVLHIPDAYEDARWAGKEFDERSGYRTRQVRVRVRVRVS